MAGRFLLSARLQHTVSALTSTDEFESRRCHHRGIVGNRRGDGQGARR
jgi:hypothetical protein